MHSCWRVVCSWSFFQVVTLIDATDRCVFKKTVKESFLFQLHKDPSVCLFQHYPRTGIASSSCLCIDALGKVKEEKERQLTKKKRLEIFRHKKTKRSLNPSLCAPSNEGRFSIPWNDHHVLWAIVRSKPRTKCRYVGLKACARPQIIRINA
jgi:hypothetical protein